MKRSVEKLRKLYLNARDATEELGITLRQLRHWEDKGLLQPELGRNRYTEKDLDRLRLIKRLVVEEGFPVDIVRRLFEKQLWDGEFDEVAYERGRSGDLTNSVLDIDSGTLLQRDEMFKRLWHEFLATADESDLEARLQQLILVFFRHIRLHSRTPVGYLGRVEDIVSRVQELSRVARLESVYGDDKYPDAITGIRLRPLLPDESDDWKRVDDLFERNESLIDDVRQMETDVFYRRGRTANRERFVDFSEYADIRR